MPGFTTHYLFGVNNIRKLRNEYVCGTVLQSIERYKTVFQLGLQGPDIFFYHLASQLRKIRPGSIVHTRWTGDFLKCLIEAREIFLTEEEQQAAQAYAAGFIGHYVLDLHMHPYVYGRTGSGEKLKKKGYAHHIGLETDIDAALLMRYAKCCPSGFPYWKAIAFDAKTRETVSNVLFYAYNMVFPELALSQRFLSAGVRSMQIGTRLTYNPYNYKRQVLATAERLFTGRLHISPVIPSDDMQCCKDPLNLEHRRWKHPWKPEEVCTDSVPQIIKKASLYYQKALKNLNCLYEADPYGGQYEKLMNQLSGLLGHKSYHTGLDWILGER